MGGGLPFKAANQRDLKGYKKSRRRRTAQKAISVISRLPVAVEQSAISRRYRNKSDKINEV